MLLDDLSRLRRAGRGACRLAPLLVAMLAAGCEPVPLLSPDARLFLQANPPFVMANGGRSVVTAVLTEPAGTFVPDGTQVFFFADLGSIDERGSTVDGVARVYFISDSRSGPARITAYTGGDAPETPTADAGATAAATATGEGSATITISIGNALPTRVVVTADPQRILSPRRSSIVANVFDANGNPVQNVPVLFGVEVTAPNPLEETLDSGGSPRYTDSNGQAFDTLYTRRLPTDPQKTVEVTAVVPGGDAEGFVIVWVN